MAFQSQTYSNSNNGYYIQEQTPVVPGDTAIQGPIEILPAIPPGAPAPQYFNRFIQSDTKGLVITENQTSGPTLLSEFTMAIDNSVSIYSNTVNQQATLTVGPARGQGLVSISADAGLQVNDSSNSGTGLQIYHDTTTNNNVIKLYNDINGPEMKFNGNSETIRFSNESTMDYIQITNQTDSIFLGNIVTGSNNLNLQQTGINIRQGQPGISQYGANIGLFNGTSLLLDSFTNTEIRTNANVNGGFPLTNITANQNGTTTFLSTITAPTVSSLQENTSTFTAVTAQSPFISIPAQPGNSGDFNHNTPLTSGKIMYDVLKNNYGAPSTTLNSTEILNTSVDSSAGGIQFYTNNNSAVSTITWMGGFIKSGSQQSLTLPSTTTAVMPYISNVSLINGLPYAPFPPGMVMPFAGNSYAAYLQNWVICDGSAYDGTNPVYTNLWNAIQTGYGGTGQSNFNVPDLRTRTIFGAKQTSFGVPNYQFTINVTGFSSLPAGTVAPNGYPNRQCLAVNSIETGGNLEVGMFIKHTDPSVDPLNYVIKYILNYNGGSSNGVAYVQPNYPILVLDRPTLFDQDNTPYTVTAAGLGFSLGSYQDSNNISQDSYAVGPHTHTQYQPGGSSSQISGGQNRSGDPNNLGPSVTYNNQNLYYTIGDPNIVNPPVYFQVPTVMNITPSRVVMNYYIHL